MDPLYKPQGVEQRWQQTWEEEGLYGADPDAPGETFVVMHPPPNISGSLTIGHCLQLSLEDALVRYHRMRGRNTLFQPGYDHGGLSTWASIGRLAAWTERRTGTLPTSTGALLLGLGAVGAAVLPRSGFWTLLPAGAAAIRVARRR